MFYLRFVFFLFCCPPKDHYMLPLRDARILAEHQQGLALSQGGPVQRCAPVSECRPRCYQRADQQLRHEKQLGHRQRCHQSY